MILQSHIDKGLKESVTSHLIAFEFLLHKLNLIDPHHLAAKEKTEIIKIFVNVSLKELDPVAVKLV